MLEQSPQSYDFSSIKKPGENENMQLEYLRRQEDALQTLSQSIFNIEKKIAESEKKSVNDENRLKYQTEQKQHRNQFEQSIDPMTLQFSLKKSAIVEEVNEEQEEPLETFAQTLKPEEKSPKREFTQISQIPLYTKMSPSALPSMPSPNTYESKRQVESYQQKLKQIQGEYQKQILEIEQEVEEEKRKSLQNFRIQEQELKRQEAQLKKSQKQSQNQDELEKMGGRSGVRGLLNRQNQKDKSATSIQSQRQVIENESKVSVTSGGMKESFKSNQSGSRTNNMAEFGSYGASLGRYGTQQSDKKDLPPIQSAGQKNFQNNIKQHGNKNRPIKKQQQEEEEIVYQLDEDGYLMDENGNYLLDENEQYIQITPDQLEELKQYNIVEEEG